MAALSRLPRANRWISAPLLSKSIPRSPTCGWWTSSTPWSKSLSARSNTPWKTTAWSSRCEAPCRRARTGSARPPPPAPAGRASPPNSTPSAWRRVPPHEPVDIGSMAVKIHPPLTDVRLVDVLDAVVKVADRPIEYSIEDYGVVFSLRGPEPAHKNEVIAFTFPGGTPAQFLETVQRQYNVDWASVADIPKEMADVRIPKLRINQASLMAVGHGAGDGMAQLGAVVRLYNQLGERKPELGRLVVTGDLTKPFVVMFVPDKALADTQPKVKVKAFSIYGINGAERDQLKADIELARRDATEYASHLGGSSGQRSLEGTVAIHHPTSRRVPTGPDCFVDRVQSISTGCQAKEGARNPGTPTTSPDKPRK